MLKFIPGFSCWKVGPRDYFVIASCAKTHEIRLYTINTAALLMELPLECPMPDVRKLVPCRWHGLSAVQRATLRDRFHSDLVDRYGDESYFPRLYNREISGCE